MGWLLFFTKCIIYVAIDPVHAVASVKPDCSVLRIRTDNGSQYKSHIARKAIRLLGIQQEFIWHHITQQNGHVVIS